MRPANERRLYYVTSSLIGWAHTQNDLCICCHDIVRHIGLPSLEEWYRNWHFKITNDTWLCALSTNQFSFTMMCWSIHQGLWYFVYVKNYVDALIARFMGPTWGPSGADRTQVGPMLAPWTLLSGRLMLRCACYRSVSPKSFRITSLELALDKPYGFTKDWQKILKCQA